MKDGIFKICIDTHGTRSIQKIIEVCTKPRHFKALIELIGPILVKLSHDINGNHVIQKILKDWK